MFLKSLFIDRMKHISHCSAHVLIHDHKKLDIASH